MTNKFIPEYFADTTVNISLTAGLVRIDFGSIQSDPSNPQNNPELVVCHRLVMPLNGFIKMFGDFNGMVQKLEQSGVLGRTNNQAAGATGAANEFKLDARGMPAPDTGTPKK